MRVDLLLDNVKMVWGGELTEARIGVDEGKVRVVAKPGTRVDYNKRVDCRGGLAIPGGIDPHVHIYDPLYEYREDYYSGTRSAVIGGITTIIDMPLTTYVDTPEKVRDRIKKGEEKSIIDFSVHAGFMNERNLKFIEGIVGTGVRTFKVFMCPPYSGSETSLAEVFYKAGRLGSLIVLHAEDNGIVSLMTDKYKPRVDQLAPHEARPPEAEAAAISRAGFYSMFFKTSIHIAHHSGKLGLVEVIRLKRAGVDVSVETCPQYLTFTRRDVERLGPYLKMAPSLKWGEDVDFLWDGVKRGYVDMLATDHAPCTKEEKEVGYSDPWRAWGGVPGLATMIPLAYTLGVVRMSVPLSRFIHLVSTNSAKRFGLRGKGDIRIGYDADIAVLDVKNERRVDGRELYKTGWSPFDGMSLVGWPTLVLSRGEIVLGDGEVYGKPGRGRFIPTLSPLNPDQPQ